MAIQTAWALTAFQLSRTGLHRLRSWRGEEFSVTRGRERPVEVARLVTSRVMGDGRCGNGPHVTLSADGICSTDICFDILCLAACSHAFLVI